MSKLIRLVPVVSLLAVLAGCIVAGPAPRAYYGPPVAVEGCFNCGGWHHGYWR